MSQEEKPEVLVSSKVKFNCLKDPIKVSNNAFLKV
jgi:hypothetical protein